MGKKKEKVIDLKPEKISEEHLKELQNAVNSINQTQFKIGQLEVTKHHALHDLAVVQDRISLIQSSLEKEYGTFDVNVMDGTINRNESPNE